LQCLSYCIEKKNYLKNAKMNNLNLQFTANFIWKNYEKLPFFHLFKIWFLFHMKKIWLKGKTYPTPHTRFKWLTPNPIIARFILNFDKTILTTNIKIEELVGVWQLISSYLYSRICDVMVNVLASSVVDRGFEPRFESNQRL
jgi:hypothetical protein